MAYILTEQFTDKMIEVTLSPGARPGDERLRIKIGATVIRIDIAEAVDLVDAIIGRLSELDAAEFVRRAERALGVAIREGQENGTVETSFEARSRSASNARAIRDGRNSSEELPKSKPMPSDFATSNELHGQYHNKIASGGIYAMTDNVTDEQFEEALADAKAEGAAPQLDDVHELRRDENQVRADAEIREGL
ncbi:hypothetical protein ACHIPZ_12650 [Antrihabitans sp. NCIMB 15449]|uniref:Uncharacterized protein n=1 Tax=Antrihabitans spumae TaxID=3373370 RepID=A0ABW7JPZ0_9NOCA